MKKRESAIDGLVFRMCARGAWCLAIFLCVFGVNMNSNSDCLVEINQNFVFTISLFSLLTSVVEI